jgi:MFS family permease
LAQRRRGVFFLGLAFAAMGVALFIQMGLNANYVAQELGLSGTQQGFLEAARESCGIFAFGLLALMAGLAEPLVGAAVLVLYAVGISGYAFVHQYSGVILMSMVWSQGLHIWMPLPNSMALSLAEPGRAGHRLGQMQAAGAIGSFLGLGGALVLVLAKLPIRPIYFVAGGAALVAAAACLAIPRNIKTPGQRLVFRRRYGLYYCLCFLDGWRKQIFLAFAGFLLVKRHGTSLTVMLTLWCIVQAISYITAPRVGRLIDRIGERKILIFYFSSLIAVFAGYALVGNKYILYGLFVMDSAFFVFAQALTTYVGRIAPPSEHTSTLSMGVAMNHVASVSMPLLGGLVWKYDYRLTFLLGAAAAVGSIFVAMKLPKKPQMAEAREIDQPAG